MQSYHLPLALEGTLTFIQEMAIFYIMFTLHDKKIKVLQLAIFFSYERFSVATQKKKLLHEQFSQFARLMSCTRIPHCIE